VDSARILFRLIWAQTRSDMQYRVSFVLRVLGSVLVLLADVALIWMFADRFGSIGGWELDPLLFIYGVSAFAFRLSDAFLGGAIERSAELIRTGKLDAMLTKPAGILLQLIGEGFAIRRVMQLIAVTPFFVIGIVSAPSSWTLGQVGIMVLMTVNATLTFGAIFTIANTLNFWAPTATEVANGFTYGGQTAAQYPLHVLDRWVRVLTLSIVPIAFAVYLPAFLILRGGESVPNPLGVSAWQSWLSLTVGVLTTLLARSVWRAALRRYRSTGS
jgi:ABC-2 type transport system permease protein